MNKKPFPPKEPYLPIKPIRSSFTLKSSKKIKGTSIYYDIDVNGDSDFNLDEHFEDQGKKRPPIPEKRYWQNLSLQDIVDLAPPGTRLCDIILGIHMPRYLNYTEVSFTKYDRDLDYEETCFQKAMSEYEKDMIKYEKDMIKYNEDKTEYDLNIKNYQIAELEKKIDDIKKGKNE